LREQLKIKDATIYEKNKRIDYLMNEQIARLNKIIEELKEEKKALLEQLDGLMNLFYAIKQMNVSEFLSNP